MQWRFKWLCRFCCRKSCVVASRNVLNCMNTGTSV
jgi:hypothetical protein